MTKSPTKSQGYRLAVLVVALLVPACLPSEFPPPPVSQTTIRVEPPTTQPNKTTSEAETSTTSPATTTTLPDAVLGLVTPNGVVVAVIGRVPGGFLVRTPCGNEAVVPSGREIGAVDVVLDPGHGGDIDPGAVGPNGLSEAVINLRVARRVEELLAERGFNVVLTRGSDYASPLGVRAALADHLHATVMLSIHHNAPTANLGTEPGPEIFVQHEQLDSRRLGELVYTRLVDALATFNISSWSRSPDAGVLEVLNSRGIDAYGMIRTPATVTALAELAYISHRPEAELMLEPGYLVEVAGALADAIETYLTTEEEEGSGYVETPRVFNPQRGIGSSVCVDLQLG